MTDAEYLLRQDIREKKSAARGARARVSGSKSKYCGLPSDKLTAAQLKRRNGPVLTYNTSKCLSYEEFRRLPDDLQRTYISTVSRVYRVPMNAIAKAMGCSDTTMCRIVQRLEYDPVRGRKWPEPGDKWFDFVAGKLTVDGVPAKYAQPSPAEDAPERFGETEEAAPPAAVYPTSGAFTVTCTQAELDRYLRLSLPADTVYEFSVHFTCAQDAARIDCCHAAAATPDGDSGHDSHSRPDREA